MAQAETTTDHNAIRRWIEQRGGKPNKVKGTEGSDGEGILGSILRSRTKSWRQLIGMSSSKHSRIENSPFCTRTRLLTEVQAAFFKFVRRPSDSRSGTGHGQEVLECLMFPRLWRLGPPRQLSSSKGRLRRARRSYAMSATAIPASPAFALHRFGYRYPNGSKVSDGDTLNASGSWPFLRLTSTCGSACLRTGICRQWVGMRAAANSTAITHAGGRSAMTRNTARCCCSAKCCRDKGPGGTGLG